MQKILAKMAAEYELEHNAAKRKIDWAETRWLEDKKGIEVSQGLRKELEKCDRWEDLTLKLSQSALRALDILYPEKMEDDLSPEETEDHSDDREFEQTSASVETGLRNSRTTPRVALSQTCAQ
jgi:hypothetical protein